MSRRRRAVPNPSYLPQVKLMEIPASPFRRYSIIAHCANSVFPDRMLFREDKSVSRFRIKSSLWCLWDFHPLLKQCTNVIQFGIVLKCIPLHRECFSSSVQFPTVERDAAGLWVVNHDCLSHHNFVRQNRNALFWRTDISSNNLFSFFSQAKENEWVTLKTRQRPVRIWGKTNKPARVSYFLAKQQITRILLPYLNLNGTWTCTNIDWTTFNNWLFKINNWLKCWTTPTCPL